MLPTLRQLQYLKLLAEHKSFMAAAEAAFVSQPALSSGIAELEKILGARLVDRSRGQVILTAVGEETLKRSEDILARTEDLVEAAHGANRPLTGRFRLGVIPTIAPFLLPKALLRLRADFPDLKLFLREDQTARLIAALKSGALDAAVIALPYDLAGLDHAFVARDEIVAATPCDHPLARHDRIAPEALKGEELILLEDGHC
ncbi:MAG: LysR substrate-binding domain-containing protein, partial [Asticcacaulis sp.]